MQSCLWIPESAASCSMSGCRGREQPCSLVTHCSTALQAGCRGPHMPLLLRVVLLQLHPLSWQQGWSGGLLLRHHLSCLMQCQLSDLSQILLKKTFHSLWGNGSHLSLSGNTPHLCLCDGFFFITDVMLARLASQKDFSGFRGTGIALCSAEWVCLP